MNAAIVTIPATPEAECPWCGRLITVVPGGRHADHRGFCKHVYVIDPTPGAMLVHFHQEKNNAA